jgi:dTDP-4-dehydrorhamnose reductase
VGTPGGDGEVDLSQVESASRDLGASLAKRDGYSLVVVKSTVPPGTTEGLVKEALSQKDDMAGEVFNIGSPGEITILELAKKIIKETNSKSEIQFLLPRPDDPKRRCPDITKATSLLEWKPKVTLDEGLRKTIQHLASKRTSVIQ